MGLGTERGISLQALDVLKSSDRIFLETYTALIDDDSIENLRRLIGKEIQVVDRTFVEDGREILSSASENEVTALVVLGDPMAATTHVDLRLRAKQVNLPSRIIHGSSILTAAPGICGLSHYKFGRTTTLSFPSGNYFPESPYDMIYENQKAGYHSLILLELTTDLNRIMTAEDGLSILLELERRKNKNVITSETLVCVIARAGSADAEATAGRFAEMIKYDFGEPMHCLIIPGKLHFKEAEALVALCGAPADIIEKVD